jgi:hypothetical protein
MCIWYHATSSSQQELRSPSEASIGENVLTKGLRKSSFHVICGITTNVTDGMWMIIPRRWCRNAWWRYSLLGCITHLKRTHDENYASPDGKPWTKKWQYNVEGRKYIILCGHYGAGISVRDHFITKEISIGDYVLSGGISEIGTFDALILIPGVLEWRNSLLTSLWWILSGPIYTALPITIDGKFRGFDQW